MEISKSSALLVIDIQQSDFDGLNADNFNSPAYKAIMNARRVLDKFRFFNLPVIRIKEVHHPDMVDFGRELDGYEGEHCIETLPGTD